MECCTKKKEEKLINEENKEDIINASNGLQLEDNQNEEYAINVEVTNEDFEPVKLLNRGSFSEVLFLRLKVNQKVYAMKILNKKLLKIKKQQTHIKTEYDLMVKINSPFIVNIKSVFQDIK